MQNQNDPLSLDVPSSVQPPRLVELPQHLEVLRTLLRQIQTNVQTALELLSESGAPAARRLLLTPEIKSETGGRVVEGFFDGQRMVGDNGQTYSIPANYASKSKLVSGDRLKLVVTASGNFLFKQIGPIERERVVGTLAFDQETRQYLVMKDEKVWKVLTASITYFHGEPGDEVVILIPKQRDSVWAAVDNIVKK